MPVLQPSKCCLSPIFDPCFWSAIFHPWFKWTGIGVVLGFAVQWKLIREMYFSEAKTPVEVIVGLLLFGLGLNFVIIGTAFAVKCGDLLKSRALFAMLVRNFPGVQHLVQAPSKILVGVWLSVAMVRTWKKISKFVECMEDDGCVGLSEYLMNARDTVCLYEGQYQFEHAGMGTEEVERSFFEAIVTELRESELCQEIFYFFPFGLIFLLTTVVAAMTLGVNMMKQQRLMNEKAKVNVESTRSKMAEEKSETMEPATIPEPEVKAKKPKLEDETQLEGNSEPKTKAARID